jgi:ribosome-associated protein
MEDMLSETEALGNLLREHKGADVLILDLREMGAWTDFFVIATASSNTHLDGLERHVKEFCNERGIEILRRSRRPGVSNRRLSAGTRASSGTLSQEDAWRIIDLGSTVIHLMSRQAREFYDLERLYSMARTNPC